MKRDFDGYRSSFVCRCPLHMRILYEGRLAGGLDLPPEDPDEEPKFDGFLSREQRKNARA